MNTSVQHLKVDQTALSLGTFSIFVSNINIPEHYLERVRPVLERVYTFIRREYDGISDIRYQLTATYELKNTETGALRHWCGSFLPKENNLSSIDTFHVFGPNFVNRLEQLCDRPSITLKLALVNVETKWEFESLTSLVITVQAKVPDNFRSLINRNLHNIQNGRTRAHATFPLP